MKSFCSQAHWNTLQEQMTQKGG